MTEDKTRQLMADYRTVFQSPEGQRVLADLMRLAGLFDVIQTTDPVTMAEKVGRQNLIKEIMVLQGVGLDVYVKHLRGDDNGNGRSESDWI